MGALARKLSAAAIVLCCVLLATAATAGGGRGPGGIRGSEPHLDSGYTEGMRRGQKPGPTTDPWKSDAESDGQQFKGNAFDHYSQRSYIDSPPGPGLSENHNSEEKAQRHNVFDGIPFEKRQWLKKFLNEDPIARQIGLQTWKFTSEPTLKQIQRVLELARMPLPGKLRLGLLLDEQYGSSYEAIKNAWSSRDPTLKAIQVPMDDPDLDIFLKAWTGNTLIVVGHVEGENFVQEVANQKKILNISKLLKKAQDNQVVLIPIGCATAQAGVGVGYTENIGTNSVSAFLRDLPKDVTVAGMIEGMLRIGETVIDIEAANDLFQESATETAQGEPGAPGAKEPFHGQANLWVKYYNPGCSPSALAMEKCTDHVAFIIIPYSTLRLGFQSQQPSLEEISDAYLRPFWLKTWFVDNPLWLITWFVNNLYELISRNFLYYGLLMVISRVASELMLIDHWIFRQRYTNVLLFIYRLIRFPSTKYSVYALFASAIYLILFTYALFIYICGFINVIKFIVLTPLFLFFWFAFLAIVIPKAFDEFEHNICSLIGLIRTFIVWWNRLK